MSLTIQALLRAAGLALLVLAAPCVPAQQLTAAPQPPEIAAKEYILLDLGAGQVLAAKNADVPIEPASLTKLMTAYLVFQALKDGKLTLTQDLPVSERAWNTGKVEASRTFLDVNSRVKVEDLLKGRIIQSGNDASVALAEGVGGTVEGFADLMNRQARVFGLKGTTFKNPEGLPAPGHVSTARDLGIIAQHVIQDFPEQLKYYSMRSFTYNKIKQDNRNLLLYRDPTVDGLKTGYTDAAGYCLIASARRDFPAGQRRLVSVVLGADSKESRADESQKLLNWGYASFDSVKLFDAGQAVATVPIWKGAAREVHLGSARRVVVTMPRGQGDQLKTEVVRPDPLVAPLAKGQQVGTIKVSGPQGVVAEIPLTALDAVPEASWLGRLIDSVRMTLK